MFRQFAAAVKAYGTAINIIIDHKLWLYFLYPVLIFIILFAGGAALIGKLSDTLQTSIISALGLPAKGSGNTAALTTALSFLVNIGLRILFFFLYSSIIKYLVLIFLSPVLSILSGRTDEIITGKKYASGPMQILKDALRGSLIAIRNLFIQSGLILCCFALMMIPVVGWLAPLFLLIVNYYFYGFTMLDYTSERYRLSVRESILFSRKNKGLAIGNGLVFATIFAIPFAGVVFAPVIAVIAATVVSIEAHKTNNTVIYAEN